MNRPLTRKLENAALAYLTANKTGTAFASLTMITSCGTTLEDEAAYDAGNKPAKPAEPDVPFLAVHATVKPDPDAPGCAAIEIIFHLKTAGIGGENTEEDGSAPESTSRLETDAILRDLFDVIMRPTDDEAAFSDANPACAALLTFANKPGGSDTRQTYRKPLHIYGLWHTDSPQVNDGTHWHDQIVLSGHAQEMDES